MTTYAKTKTTTMPTLAIRNGIPAEFESLFRPLHSERHIPETPLEQTRQYRLRIGRAALRSLSEIRPSRVVALATVIAAGVNLGIAIGVQLKDTMEGRPDHPEAAAPAKPGQEQKEQEDAGQTNKKRAPKDQQSQHPVGPTKQPQPNKTVDITDTETVAKAIATNKELPKVG
ncbi:MAG TPA: hypothetical protein VLA92_01825, partial [Candidatus Saccharimonadales bacterium]|nr:hypothetical protein [Candidatus Saccharimonadales bacterium]